MANKPKRASEYESEQVELVRATCLYVATKLGDLMDDLVIIGGLVPSLIVKQTALPEDVDVHVGTMDLDVGLQLALLDEGRYRKLTERLRDAGFEMDKNDEGNPTRQRWTITGAGTVTVDFLIAPSRDGDRWVRDPVRAKVAGGGTNLGARSGARELAIKAGAEMAEGGGINLGARSHEISRSQILQHNCDIRNCVAK